MFDFICLGFSELQGSLSEQKLQMKNTRLQLDNWIQIHDLMIRIINT